MKKEATQPPAASDMILRLNERSEQLGQRRSEVIRVEVSRKLYEAFNHYVGVHFNSPEDAVIHSMKTMVLLRLKGLRGKKPPHSL